MRMLVATDGSQDSERAVKFASKLAVESGAGLTLIHVTPVVRTTKEDVITILKEEIGSAEEAGKKYLESAQRIAREQGIKAGVILRKGKPADEILKESSKFDMIVAASHGKGKVKEILLGSITTELVHRSKVPVLVVK